MTAILALILVGFPPPASYFPANEMPLVAAMKERIAEAPEPEPEPAEVAPAPQAELTAPEPTPVEHGAIAEPWASVAECESHGQWDYNPATATWGNRLFEGGLQFSPGTWDAFRDPGHPEAAYLASPSQQIEVAERVLAAQGWGAWPHCSRKLGLR